MGFGVQLLRYSFLLVLYESEVRIVNHAEHLVQFQTLNIGNGSGLEQRVEVLALEGNLLDRHIHHAPCFHNKGDLILIVLRLICQHIIEQLMRANIEKTLNIATGSEETRFRTQRLTSIETLEQFSFFVLRQIVEVGNREDGAGKLVLNCFGKLTILHTRNVGLALGIKPFVHVGNRRKLGEGELVIEVLGYSGETLFSVHDTVDVAATLACAIVNSLCEHRRDRIAENHTLNES